MPSIFKSAAALAMAGVAFANPMDKRYSPDQCAAAVTGKAALGDDNLRKEHCSSFFKTIVTPAAVTVTTTITDKAQPSNWNQWQKKDVTVCPNEVPNYASACDEKGYRSACNAWGVSYETTYTIPATTTTKSVYVYNGGKGASCPAGATATVVSTKTETSTAAGSTITVAGSTTTSTVAGSTATTTTTVIVGGYPGKNGTDTVTVTSTVAGSTTTVAGSTTTVAGSTTTTTVTAAASTVTIGGGYPGKNGTETVTVTAPASTVTVTAGSGSTTSASATTSSAAVATTSGAVIAQPTTCLTADKAKEFTDAFKNLLEFTNKGSAATGNGPYNRNISAKYLAEDFKDYSDSINFMAHFPVSFLTPCTHLL